MRKCRIRKILGCIYLCNNLKWSHHVKFISNEAKKKLCLIKHLFSHCIKEIKQNLYNQLVRSKLEYSCVTWNPQIKVNN